MPYFKDSDDVYEHVGRLLADLAGDEVLGPRFRSADTILRCEHTNPEATITVHLCKEDSGEVEFGPSETEPEVTMGMEADVAHRFWLGEVNVAVALARGQVRVEGPVEKILRLVPLTAPTFRRYRRQLLEQGRDDLLNQVRPGGADSRARPASAGPGTPWSYAA